MSFDAIYDDLREKINSNPDYIAQLNYGLEDTFLTSFLVAAVQNFKSADPEEDLAFRKMREQASERALAVFTGMFILGIANSVHHPNSSMDSFMQTVCRTLGSAFNNPKRFGVDMSMISSVGTNINAMGETVCDFIRDKVPMTDAQKSSIDIIAQMFFAMSETDRKSYDTVRDNIRHTLENVYEDMLGPRPHPSTRAN